MSTSELDSRNIAITMRKSVENLVISSQDAIGQSISQALTFSGVITQHTNQMLQETGRSISRSPSPSFRNNSDNTSDSIDNEKLELQPGDGAGDLLALPGTKVTSPTPPRGPEARKKKSWYSALYPTYKSRSEDFKRLFKDLDDERLIVDYSCAIQKDILAHGRLYASQNYLCFHANIFGWETSLALRWKDVTAITKEKTALVIPNAILVCSESEKHFFASFSGRDKAYLMLFRVWQNALMDQPMTSQEIWQWVHSCYGSELGFNSDEEGYGRDDDDKPPATPLPEDLGETSSMEAGAGESREDVRARGGTPPLEVTDGAAPGRARGDAPPTDASDTSDSEPDKHSSACTEQCTASHEGTLLLDQQYQMGVDQLFTLVFTSSRMTLELLAKRNSRDFVHADWQHNAETGLKSRQISYTLGLTTGPIGPKEVYVTETQTMNKCTTPGRLYSIDVTSDNAGIPYADYFTVETHYCARRAPQGAALQIYGQVKYRKTLWPLIKGFLQKNALGGLEEYTKMLDLALRGEADPAPPRRPGRRRRRAASSTGLIGFAPAALPAPAPLLGGGGGGAARGRGRGAGWLAALVALLLAANVALYWKLEAEWDKPKTHYDLKDRVNLLNSAQLSDWSRLLEQHAARHHSQLAEWRRALLDAIQHLDQTEQSLAKLLDSIKPSLERAQSEATDRPEEAPNIPQEEL